MIKSKPLQSFSLRAAVQCTFCAVSVDSGMDSQGILSANRSYGSEIRGSTVELQTKQYVREEATGTSPVPGPCTVGYSTSTHD